jgi:hypothetical protein
MRDRMIDCSSVHEFMSSRRSIPTSTWGFRVIRSALLRARMPRFALLVATAALVLPPAAAHADRRYFPLTTTPYLSSAGENEVELWLTTRSGKQEPGQGVALQTRAELEHAFSERLTAAAYVNYVRPPGEALRYDSASLELIAQPVAPGRWPFDPALYLEATESGEELELEPKLLAAHRSGRWVAALNLGGDLEFRHNDEERLPGGKILKNAYVAEVTGGLAREIGPRLALGVEARLRSEHPNFGRQSAALVSLGPTLNLDLGRTLFTLGVLPQIAGTPRTTGRRNLADFERTQVRAVLAIEL